MAMKQPPLTLALSPEGRGDLVLALSPKGRGNIVLALPQGERGSTKGEGIFFLGDQAGWHKYNRFW